MRSWGGWESNLVRAIGLGLISQESQTFSSFYSDIEQLPLVFAGDLSDAPSGGVYAEFWHEYDSSLDRSRRKARMETK